LTDREKKRVFENTNTISDFSISKLFDHELVNETTGYIHIDTSKLLNVILYFAKKSINKTVLAKMLFYLDFSYYKENALSFTGISYVKMQHGPMPYKYLTIIDNLCYDKIVDVNVSYYNNYEQHEITANEDYKSEVFNTDELEFLLKIYDHFKNHTSKKISDLSHSENAWISILL